MPKTNHQGLHTGLYPEDYRGVRLLDLCDPASEETHQRKRNAFDQFFLIYENHREVAASGTHQIIPESITCPWLRGHVMYASR